MDKLLATVEETLRKDMVFASSVIDMLLDICPDVVTLKQEARDDTYGDLPRERVSVREMPDAAQDI